MVNRQSILSVLAIGMFILTAFFACEKKPTAPVRENPFDPKNIQTKGDPFKLTAKIANGGILLEWNKPKGDITAFNIYRSEQEKSGYSKIKNLPANTNRFTDTNVQNGHSYWYVVTAVNSRGEESTRTNIAPVNIKTQPVLVINGGAQYTTTRQVNLTILANTATQMILSNNADFSGAQWENYATSKTWSLESGDGEKTVYMKVKYDNGKESNVVTAKIKPQPMNPSIVIIADTVQYTPTREVKLKLSATGSNLKMKLSEDSMFTGIDWQPYLATPIFQLSTGDGPKKVYAKFKNDFEIESAAVQDDIIMDTTPPTAVLTITPDSGITSETSFQFDPTASSDNLTSKNDLRVRYDYENDGTFDTGWEELQIKNYEFQIGGGDKTVKMQLTDGAWQVETTVNVFVNTRPLAQFTANQTSYFPLIMHFDASASSDYEDGHNLYYRWDFDGDGTWDTNWLPEDTISHEYSYDGTYTIKLSVQDMDQLTGENEVHVEVKLFLEMVYVAGGTFTMGDTWGDGESDERPTHTVTVNSFYIGKYEVTNAHAVEVFNWALAQGKITANSSTVKNAEGDPQELLDLDAYFCQISYNGSQLYVENNYDNNPVMEISWYGAIVFCNYLSEMEGLTPVYDLNDWSCNWNANGYRLPTEAEWEYAARGGNQSQGYKYSGSNNVDEVAWYSSNSGGHTHEIGTKQPNELGIYDMSGNVWEWCWDWYSSSYYSSSPQDNPKGPDSGSYRVLRGGSWYYDANFVRVAYRGNLNPGFTSHGRGFRILRAN